MCLFENALSRGIISFSTKESLGITSDIRGPSGARQGGAVTYISHLTLLGQAGALTLLNLWMSKLRIRGRLSHTTTQPGGDRARIQM